MIKILFVEDDPLLRELGQVALGFDFDMEVHAADNATTALALLDAGDWSPDLLLLDVMLPDIDGPSLLRAIRARPRFCAVPAIFLTARSQPDDIARYLDLGAAGVMTKPFDPMTLAASVRALMAG